MKLSYRLWTASAMAVLGIVLAPGEADFWVLPAVPRFPYAVPLWFGIALVAAIWIRRTEGSGPLVAPAWLIVPAVGIVVALCHATNLGWIACLLVAEVGVLSLIHLLVAQSNEPRERYFPESMVRASGIGLAAPFFAFGAREQLPMQSAARRVISALPFVFAGCLFVAPITHGAFAASAFSFGVFLWAALAIIWIVGPWPLRPRFPLLRSLPTPPPLPLGGLVVFLAIPILWLMPMMRRWAVHILSGKLFAYDISQMPRTMIWAIDQDSIHRAFVHATLFAVILAPYLAAARWMRRWGGKADHYCVLSGSVILVTMLLTHLFIATYCLVQYIHSMGFTPKRVMGLAYAGLNATVLLYGVFAAMRIVGRPGRR